MTERKDNPSPTTRAVTPENIFVSNYLSMFNMYLDAWPILSDDRQSYFSPVFESLGITQVQKLVPTITIEPLRTNKSLGLQRDVREVWMNNSPFAFDPRFPHAYLQRSLESFWRKPASGLSLSLVDSYVIEDNLKRHYLVWEKQWGDQIENPYMEVKELESWKKLKERYGFEGIVGIDVSQGKSFYEGRFEINGTSRFLLDENFIGKIREIDTMFRYVDKFRMTDEQIAEFERRILLAYDMKVPINYSEVAATITGKKSLET